jgi:hypothetical protein
VRTPPPHLGLYRLSRPLFGVYAPVRARVITPDLDCCAQGDFVQTSSGVPRKRDSLGVDKLDTFSWDKHELERNDVRRVQEYVRQSGSGGGKGEW